MHDSQKSLGSGTHVQWLGDKLSAEGAAAETGTRKPSSRKKRKLVLVVDDEPVITDTLLQILRLEGFDALGVHDGLSAVEEAVRSKPDIVLADVAMPRLNGVEAAKRILAKLPETRIVLFSGQAETADLLARARAEGFEFEVLAKPVKPDHLLRTLRSSE